MSPILNREVSVMATLLVAHQPSSTAVVRRALARDLASYPPEFVDEVVLVASELVGNAIRHSPVDSSGQMRVGWDTSPDGVNLRVTDASPDAPYLRPAGRSDLNGRGLGVVQALSAEWGFERADGGKTVWAYLAVETRAVARSSSGSDGFLGRRMLAR
jgi:serine/threonine-protein kinase RsbW